MEISLGVVYIHVCMEHLNKLNQCSCLCGGHVMTLPILLPGYVGLPAAYRPCQSRTLVYCLNILCHSVLYLCIIIIIAIPPCYIL